MRRLLLAFSLTALLFGVVSSSAQTARPAVSVSRVNFGAVQAGLDYQAEVTVKNNTAEAIYITAAPAITPPFYFEGGWTCGVIQANTTCTSNFTFNTDFALASGTNRITQSVPLTYTNGGEKTYTATLMLIAVQHAQK